MTYAIIALIVLAALLGYRFSWKTSTYANIKVVDGDSVTIIHKNLQYECRITGYDAPEWNQIHGRQAAAALRTMLFAGARWKIIGVDGYNRNLIKMRNTKGSIARQMVAAGHAHNNANWGFQEFIAKITRRGLWGKAERLSPATFRALTK